MRPALLARTERIGYVAAWDEQRRVADLVRSGDSPAVIWLLEHDPVYTYGRHGTREDLFISDEVLTGMGATCVATDRGGQMTWHGPGQVTGYVISDLRGGRGVRRFVAALVDAMTDTCRLSGVPAAESDHVRMGTYAEGRKLGSVGIRVAEGVSMHGLALNRSPDLEWFRTMSACGAPDVVATSIAAEGGDPDRDRVEAILVHVLGERLRLVPQPSGLMPEGCP
ncbi:MAG: lipoyl(octanoyl) transferase [Thermoleophilia bacterium]|nr:lipoyl(octanoyl) transferase [Thermoleophilia bacterium]